MVSVIYTPDLIIYNKGVVYPKEEWLDIFRTHDYFIPFSEIQSIDIYTTRGGVRSLDIKLDTKTHTITNKDFVDVDEIYEVLHRAFEEYQTKEVMDK